MGIAAQRDAQVASRTDPTQLTIGIGRPLVAKKESRARRTSGLGVAIQSVRIERFRL